MVYESLSARIQLQLDLGKVRRILDQVLPSVIPSDDERRKLFAIYNNVKSRLEMCLSRVLKNFEISLQGSVAKDTFLRGETDIDIFVLLDPTEIDRRWVEHNFVPIVLECFSDVPHVVEYATHPYVTLFIDGIEVNVVPAFRVEDPRKLVSAVDRTPFHTRYIIQKLSPEQRNEVRLLKKFMKSLGVYGAEIAVQGFSGYLAELLIAAYGSFIDVLRNALNWKAYRTCIDIEGYYSSPRECLAKFRDSVLVVVDPIDPDRNAAAAVSLRSFSIFKLCSALFLSKPSTKFFEGYSPKPVEEYDIVIHVRSSSTRVVGFVFNITKRVPDIVWGQLRRVEKVLFNTLRSHGFTPIYVDSWISNDMSKAVTLCEVIDSTTTCIELHEGPYAYDLTNALRFIEKNLNSVAGPWIDPRTGRLYSLRIRKRCKPSDLLPLIEQQIRSFLTSLEVIEHVSSDIDLARVCRYFGIAFRAWLSEFLFKKRLSYLASA